MSLTRELIFEIYIRHKNHQRVIFLCEIFVQNGTTWNYVDCRSWNSNFHQNKNHSCDMVLGSTGWVPKKVKCQKSTSELGPGGSLKLPVTYVWYVWWCSIIFKGSIRVEMNWCWPLPEMASSRSKFEGRFQISVYLWCTQEANVWAPMFCKYFIPHRVNISILGPSKADVTHYWVTRMMRRRHKISTKKTKMMMMLTIFPNCSLHSNHTGPCGAKSNWSHV